MPATILRRLIVPAATAALLALGGCVAYPAYDPYYPAYGYAPAYPYPAVVAAPVVIGGGWGWGHGWGGGGWGGRGGWR